MQWHGGLCLVSLLARFGNAVLFVHNKQIQRHRHPEKEAQSRDGIPCHSAIIKPAGCRVVAATR